MSDSSLLDNTDTSIGTPTHTSSPVRERNPRNRLLGNPPLRVLDINTQSILAKKESFWNLLSATKPDIIRMTETWLHPDIRANEFLPATMEYKVAAS